MWQWIKDHKKSIIGTTVGIAVVAAGAAAAVYTGVLPIGGNSNGGDAGAPQS